MSTKNVFLFSDFEPWNIPESEYETNFLEVSIWSSPDFSTISTERECTNAEKTNALRGRLLEAQGQRGC
jgi:hypothetical protein